MTIKTSNPMVETFTPRMQRGSQILANGTVPREIVDTVNNAVWEIPSQTAKGTFYRVERVRNIWRCECPDNEFRKVNCKHIHAISFWLKLRKKMYEEKPMDVIMERPQPAILEGDTTPQEDVFFCKNCGYDDIIKHGKRKTKNGIKIRYKCKTCGHTFVEKEEGFQNMVFDPKIVTLALDLYFKGTSLRKIEEEKFRNLIESSPNMIFINKRGRVVYANEKCEEVMGYKREELCSKDFDFMDLIAPESKDLVKKNFQMHMEGKDISPYEYKLVTKDGREIIAIHTTNLIDFEGEKAILGIVTDITERKKAEDELKNKLEELEKWHKLTVGREQKMVELKKRIKELEKINKI